jgi:spermidine synthase
VDLNALTGIGPRVMATEGTERARAYLRGELEKLGLEIEEQQFTIELPTGDAQAESLPMRNLMAAIPGTSSDVFLLVTPYDTREYENFRFLGTNDGASGAAVVLELTRVLAEKPLPYTTWVVFLEGEAQRKSERGGDAHSHFGSMELARRLRVLNATRQVRLAVVLDRVCDADLRIARDLRSHRMYREEFWRAAERLGHDDAFPRNASYESPVASHLGLLSEGFRKVVALVDTSFGGDEPPGLYAGTEDDNPEHCSRDSLGVVGEVTVEALDRIGKRMTKVDRFAETPPGGVGVLRLEQLRAELAERARKSSSFNGTVRVVDLGGTRQLITGTEEKELLQSSMDLEQPHRLVDNYTQICSMLTSLHPSPQHAFNIGLGGGVLSRFHLHRYEGSKVQSVELDPVVIELAKEFFEVVDPRHTILEGDGAAVLKESEDTFDAIWIDAYTADEGVPDVFTGRKFIDTLPTKLNSGGIVVANLWAKEPEAFEKLVGTYKKGFSHGIRVTVPGASNNVVAVGDFPGLTCTAFRETLEKWSSQDLVDLEWTEQDTPPAERCIDL